MKILDKISGKVLLIVAGVIVVLAVAAVCAMMFIK